jgi:hypothetical protein
MNMVKLSLAAVVATSAALLGTSAFAQAYYSASADDFDQRWAAVLDGEVACLLYANPDQTKTPAHDPNAGLCADIHRLHEAMQPVADQRYRDAEQRLTRKRLQKDLRTAQPQK